MKATLLGAPSAATAAHEAAWTAISRRRRLTGAGIGVVFALCVVLAGWIGEVDLPHLADGFPQIVAYIANCLPDLHAATLGSDIAAWFWSFDHWALLLADTVLIAYVGTAAGALIALPLSLLASARHSPNRVVMIVARRVLEFARSVPVLVFALVFVIAFGLGPLPGALALSVHVFGVLGKLYAEAHENASDAPVAAVRAVGGGWIAQARFGVLPQSLPSMVSNTLIRLEISVREATVLGFVGAGGIGEELYLVVRRFDYTDISAIVLMCLAVVTALDLVCGWLRRRVTAGGMLSDRTAWGLCLALLAVLAFGLWRIDASPLRMINGTSRLGYLVGLMFPPSDGGAFGELAGAMGATIAMAFLGSVVSGAIALPLAIIGAANVMPVWPLRFLLRRCWDILRGIDSLIWGLIFVAAVGMGPFAGILAMATPDIGALAKVFSEAIEAVDRRSVDGVRAAGAGPMQVVNFGVLPQVMPLLLSQSLYFFESNVRSATILGIVGAGGIGLELSERLRINDWDQVGFILIMIIVVVGVLDALSRRLRLRFA